MLVDITLKVTPDMIKDVPGSVNKSLAGHVGTHFDVMNKEFPLEYTRRKGIVFDVSSIRDADICPEDISMEDVEEGMFVAFYTGFLAEAGYGSTPYFKNHPQLSQALIDGLLEKGVSIIGVDCAGIRRGAEHVPADQRCADKGTFVIENLCDLQELVSRGGRFTANTYPLRYAGITGLPCRVVAEI